MPTNGSGKYRVWLVLDREGDERGDPEENYYEAVREARDLGGSVVEITYTYEDLETVDDFTPHCDECHETISQYDEDYGDFDGEHCRECQLKIAAEEAEEAEE